MAPLDMPGQPGQQQDTDTLTLEQVSPDTPWQTLLHNDPVNLTDWVTTALMQVLKVDQASAENLMLRAHTEGSAAVFDGTMAECQKIAEQLMTYQLWATISKAGS
jgi:ATP-dependent Clp protease adaptor protein ClpS